MGSTIIGERTLGSPPDNSRTDDSAPITATTATAVGADQRRSRPPALPRGTQLGRYLTLDLLGVGGMGAVYKADDPELDRRVALKLVGVDSRGPAAAEARAHLLSEAKALAKLSHPNVVAVYDVGTIDDDVFVAMELIEGQTLRDWLGCAQRSHAEILRVFIAAGRGLAAAHAAGLIHRDFKPSNVIVGDDGRVRVVDFGLAQVTAPPEQGRVPGPPLDKAAAARGDSVTFIGTPAYMAPEQHLFAEQTEHTDQFSFCVALYQALYGQRPFAGKGAEQRANVLAGKVEDAPEGAHVSARLRRILLRGLEVTAADRFVDMATLLVALSTPSLSARAFRALLTVVATLAVVASAAGGWSLWNRHERGEHHRARSAAAVARLTAVEEQIAALAGKQRYREADEAFLAFAGMEEHRNTEALTLGWLRRAQRQHDRGRLDEELRAFAKAYAVATRWQRQREALLGIARIFHRRWAWSRLEVLIETLERKAPGRTPARETLPLRLDAALARRDLTGAQELWAEARGLGLADPVLAIDAAPIVAALATATRSTHHAGAAVVADLDGDGVKELLLVSPDGTRLTAVRIDGALTELWSHAIPAGLGAAVFTWAVGERSGSPAMLVARHDLANGERYGVLYRVGRGGFELLYRWPEYLLSSAASADVDGDGAAEIYVGLGPYKRQLRRLEEGPDGWRTVAIDTAINRADSDVLALLPADLDGDDRPELVAALGAWRAYDVRVLRPAPIGAGLELVARRKLGYVDFLALLPASATSAARIVAAKSDFYPSRVAFAANRPHGEPAGLYVLALRAGELLQLDYIPLPAPEGSSQPVALEPLHAGDFDGDGLVDLVQVSVVGDDRHRAQFYRGMADGGFAVLSVGGIDVLATANVDDDPADELLVRLTDVDDRVWVLGAGADPLPIAEREEPAVVPASVPAAARGDAAFARSWERSEDLVGMGLELQAADVLDELAALATDSHLRHLAQYRSADLLTTAGRDRLAAQRYEQAAADPVLAWAALDGAADCLVREHRFVEAARHVDRQLDQDNLSADQRRHSHARRRWLAPLAAERDQIVMTFDRPLSPTWRIIEPLSLRRDARAKTLRLDVFGDQRTLALLALDRTAETISLAVELDLDRSEWASGVSIVLRPAGGSDLDVVGVGAAAWGGGGILERELGCFRPGDAVLSGIRGEIDGAAEAASVTLKVALVPALAEVSCVVTDSAGNTLHRSRSQVTHPLALGHYELAIERAGDRGVLHPVWTSLGIRRIEISGAAIRPSLSPDQTERGHHLLVEGDAAGALAAYQTSATDSHPIARVMALERLGRHAAALSLLRRIAGHKDVAPAIGHLLRTEERAFGPLIRAALGPEYYLRYADAWLVAVHDHLRDPLMHRSLTSMLAGLYETNSESIHVHGEHLKVTLLRFRGRAWWFLGRHGLARLDLTRSIALGESLLPKAIATVGRNTIDVRSELEQAYGLLAAIEASAGNTELALAHSKAAIAISATPEISRDLLILRPEIAARRGDPAWQSLFE